MSLSRTLVAVLALGLAACASAGAPPRAATPTAPAPASAGAPQLGPQLAANLAKFDGTDGLAITAHGDLVRFGTHELSAHAEIEHEAQDDGTVILGARVDITLDGRPVPALSGGVIGFGDTRAQAEALLTLEWASVYGYPIVAALGRRLPADQARFTVGSYSAFPGLAVLRGPSPGDGWDRSFIESLVSALEPQVDRLDPSGPDLHLLTVFVTVKDGRVESGECRVDGEVSDAVLERVAARPWPAGTYMFKQAFVLAR